MHYGYARVSSQEQAQGQSVDAQCRRLREAGIPEHQIVIEIGSASKERTPELQRLFKLARKGEVQSITAIRQDRFQRNRRTAAALWELIDQHDVVLRFLDQPDIDKNDPTSILQAQILGAFSQFETEQLSQRVKNGIEQNRLQLKHHGRPPCGYINDGGTLKPDPTCWDIYKQVVATYIETGSSTAARRLRHQLTGQPWGPSSFARWLLSPNLRGCVCYGLKTTNPVIHPDQHEPLISPAEWDAIQAVRAANRVVPGAYRAQAKPTIGSGLFVCGDCGRRLAFKQKSSRRVAIYSCPTVKGAGCQWGHTCWVGMESVPDLIRRCLAMAATQIAAMSVPLKREEPQALRELREERDQFAAMKSERAKKQAAELDVEINQMAAALQIGDAERDAAITAEFCRLTGDRLMKRMSDDELRGLAVRYGLQVRVDQRDVARFKFDRLGVRGVLC